MIRTTSRAATVLLLVAAALMPLPARQAWASSAVVGPLTTNGNQIIDGRGQPITLRGVATEWLDNNSFTYNGGPLSGPDIDAARAWGANVYRVYLGEQYWNSDQCQYAASYAATVKGVVDRITGDGMVALIDLHHNTRFPCVGPAGQQQMADADAVNYWTSVATMFKDNPLVAFDLYNEPHDISWDIWLNGGLVQPTKAYPVAFRAAGMQQMYNAVRATGAQNLVFVGGNGWANIPPPSDHLVAGYNIVYAVHYYTCPNSLPPPNGTCAAANPYDPSPGLNPWASLLTQKPVMITEFGWGDPNDGTYTTNVINWAEAHHVGWIDMDFAHVSSGFNLGLFDAFGSFNPTPGTGLATQRGLAANP